MENITVSALMNQARPLSNAGQPNSRTKRRLSVNPTPRNGKHGKWTKTTEFGTYIKEKKTLTPEEFIITEAKSLGIAKKHAGSKPIKRLKKSMASQAEAYSKFKKRMKAMQKAYEAAQKAKEEVEKTVENKENEVEEVEIESVEMEDVS